MRSWVAARQRRLAEDPAVQPQAGRGRRAGLNPSTSGVMTVLLLYDPYEPKLLVMKDTVRHKHPSRGQHKKLSLEVQAELRKLTTQIDGLDERAARHFGVNRTDLRCLDVLTSTGPMRPSELAAAVRLTSGGLSIALERLERASYIRRRQHEHDRRSVVVEATEKAHAVDEEVFGAIEERMRRLLDHYQTAELEVVRRFLQETRSAVAPPAL